MDYPITKGTINNTSVVVHEYRYKDVRVHTGYKTNGADIPRWFWSWTPPFKPKYMPAVLIHDFLCDRKEYDKADRYYEEILLNIEDSFKTRMMIKAVKFYSKYIR